MRLNIFQNGVFAGDFCTNGIDSDIGLLYSVLNYAVQNIRRFFDLSHNVRVEIHNMDEGKENVVYALRQLIGDFELIVV